MTSSSLSSARYGQPLSEREVQVVRLAANGLSNAEIGRELYLMENTVKSHMQRASRKLGATGRAHVVAVALRAGILSLRDIRSTNEATPIPIGPPRVVQRVRVLLRDWQRLQPPPGHLLRHWWDHKLTQLAAAINDQEHAA